MSERDWQVEVQQNLAQFERCQNSVLYNPSLARLYIERGAAVGVVVVFTAYGSTLRAISQDGRTLFLGCSIFGAALACTLAAIGLAGLIHQRRQQAIGTRRDNDPRAIGW